MNKIDQPETAVVTDLKDLVDKRQELIQTIHEVTFTKHQTEQLIMGKLIKDKMFDVFSINWRKLDAIVHERGRYGRH